MAPPAEPQFQSSRRRDLLSSEFTIVFGVLSGLLLLSPVGRVLAPDSVLPIIAISITTVILGMVLASQTLARSRHAPERHREKVLEWLSQMNEWNRLHHCAACAGVFLVD